MLKKSNSLNDLSKTDLWDQSSKKAINIAEFCKIYLLENSII